MTRIPRRLRLPRRKQHDRSDCGAACLAAIAEFYGSSPSIARIRQFASTGAEGTTVLGVIEAAAAIGLTARGVRATPDQWPEIPLPAIAHLIVGGVRTHFVVVYRASRVALLVMDPSDGSTRWVERARFLGEWTGVAIVLAPSLEFEPGHRGASTLLRFWSLVRPHRTVMLEALVGAGLYTILGLSTAVFVQKLVDHVLPDGNRNLLNLLGIAMLVVLASQTIVGVLKDMLVLRTGQRIDAALVLGYYRHVLSLPQRFFDTMRVGEIIARVNDGVKIRAFINDVALDLAVNTFVVVFSLALMVAYSPRLALLMGASLALLAVVYVTADRRNRRTQRKLMESGAELESHLVESVAAASTVKRFGLESFALERVERRLVRVLRQVHDSSITGILSRAGSDLVTKVAAIGLLWVGGRMVIDRSLTAGELMSFYALVGYLTGPAVALVATNRTVQDALIASDRLFEILDLEREDGRRASRISSLRGGDVRIERVEFGYGGKGRILHGLEMTAEAGRITAIVGESGSGKSTLAALIQGVYQPTAGQIRIGGHDVREFEPTSLRELVGVVPQQVHLFAGSILNNVAIGDERPDLRRVIGICQALGLAEFIDRLPDGYRTEVGENGGRLSGGQRQRVAIARALYRRPRILILDEATASLDAEAEARVRLALRHLRSAGRTLIMITHRFASVRDADRIYVVEDGRVIESGRHAELVGRGGAYLRLWQRQGLPAA